LEDRFEGIGVIWDFEKVNKERGRRFVERCAKYAQMNGSFL